MINSYPSIYTIDHAALKELFSDPVLIEEKVDGSQFSFGVKDGELFCRSKNQQMIVELPAPIFADAVETIKNIAHLLHDGWTYRAEVLTKPQHNTLIYDRIPSGCVIIYDIDQGKEDYLSYDNKALEAQRLGLEVVPRLFEGVINADALSAFLELSSCLGTTNIEGIVVKNYHRFDSKKKILLGKFVRDDFAEINAIEWKRKHPSNGDIVMSIITALKTDARWLKAVQHLRDAGKLTGTMKDTPELIKEIQADVLAECEQEIKDMLFQWCWHKIERGIVSGFPEWWKEKLSVEE